MTEAAALAALYPSANAAGPAPVAAAAPSPAAAPAAPAAAGAPAEAAPAPAEALAAEPVRPDPGTLYFDPIETRSGLVKWDEPAAASAAEITFDTSFVPHADLSPAGDAERARLAEAAVAAGVGATLAREVYADAARAAKPGYVPTTHETCQAELREAWGSRYESTMEGVFALVRKAAAVNPEIGPFLRDTGLGNDPAFIRKLANRVAAQARQRK